MTIDFPGANGEEQSADWDAGHHVATADELYDSFDANVGTNWERVRECAAETFRS